MLLEQSTAGRVGEEFDYVVRFNDQLYFLNRFNEKEIVVRHILKPVLLNAKDEDNAKLLKIYNKLFEKLGNTDGYMFSPTDSDFYDLLMSIGVALKGSKLPDFHQNIKKFLNIPDIPDAPQTKILAKFGMFPEKAPVSREEEAHLQQTATLDL